MATRKCVKWGRTRSRKVCRKFSGGKKASKTSAKSAGKKTCKRFKKVWSPIYNTDVKRCVKWTGKTKKSKAKRSTARKGGGKTVSFMTKNGPVRFKARTGSKRGRKLDRSFEGIISGW